MLTLKDQKKKKTDHILNYGITLLNYHIQVYIR